ncbi:hypothetical protein VCRA2119O147_280010 [Vibrio crassostreae]|nr:hypothetical protein VCRA2114O369_100134 [Vibrio crassostreae]CAK1715446.1 hypothetical protein VCRA2113O207_110089 [Vibrio crassostreae]CAK1757953.1 hypothetical protein VCRA2119O245_140066 [Vibrio crassostreae]CAK1785248.1 hypothetical protein VCRA2112E186_160065 [Vibrio crassostreae]CAK1915972.1 hypothetical protein VCRA2113O120_240025 [Vibrio crassostreae]
MPVINFIYHLFSFTGYSHSERPPNLLYLIPSFASHQQALK